MTTAIKQVPLGFVEQPFPAGTHMCLIYTDEQERKGIMAKYLKSGLANGERVAYFGCGSSKEEVLSWLACPDSGCNHARHMETLDVWEAEEVYCPGGKFVPDEMLEKLRQYYDKSAAAGYPACRATGEMEWAAKGIPGSERLAEYECRVNHVLATHPLTAICQYDARRFDGATIFNVLRVHPQMIVHGQVVRNPHYVKPEEFLRTQAAGK